MPSAHAKGQTVLAALSVTTPSPCLPPRRLATRRFLLPKRTRASSVANTHPLPLGDVRLLRCNVRLLLLRSEVPPDLPQHFRDGWDRGAWGEGGLHRAEPLPRKAKERACKQSGSRVLRRQRGTVRGHTGACAPMHAGTALIAVIPHSQRSPGGSCGSGQLNNSHLIDLDIGSGLIDLNIGLVDTGLGGLARRAHLCSVAPQYRRDW